ncbi:hypothetical protein A9Q96_01055 [Rhodobacterales bacterium 52_120_T64]|nr:hypothetical protein A9Q96_01055 [Rhodobacterales bacterium 52_120_T64]
MANLPGIVGAVVLGVVMSQFPEFTQQYQQRLGGAVDELRIITDEFDRAATDQGLSRDEALAAYTGSEFLEIRAFDLEATFARFERLSEDLTILENANALRRLKNFTHMTDNTLVERTWQAFKPAVPVTSEGLTFAAFGGVAGFAGFAGLSRLVFRRRRKYA